MIGKLRGSACRGERLESRHIGEQHHGPRPTHLTHHKNLLTVNLHHRNGHLRFVQELLQLIRYGVGKLHRGQARRLNIVYQRYRNPAVRTHGYVSGNIRLLPDADVKNVLSPDDVGAGFNARRSLRWRGLAFRPGAGLLLFGSLLRLRQQPTRTQA